MNQQLWWWCFIRANLFISFYHIWIVLSTASGLRCIPSSKSESEAICNRWSSNYITLLSDPPITTPVITTPLVLNPDYQPLLRLYPHLLCDPPFCYCSIEFDFLWMVIFLHKKAGRGDSVTTHNNQLQTFGCQVILGNVNVFDKIHS